MRWSSRLSGTAACCSPSDPPQAGPDERGGLIELQRRASLMWEEDRAFLLADPGMIDLPAGQISEGHVFVWEAAGVVLGFAVVLPRDDGDAELDGLFVEPGAWGRGIGRRLVDHAADVARQRGCLAGQHAGAGLLREMRLPGARRSGDPVHPGRGHGEAALTPPHPGERRRPVLAECALSVFGHPARFGPAFLLQPIEISEFLKSGGQSHTWGTVGGIACGE